jgi:hypothetical protein
MMTPEQRAQIIKQTKDNLKRFQEESLAQDGASSSAEARGAGGNVSPPRAPPPPPSSIEDPIARWKADAEMFERQKAAAVAERRRAEQQHTRQGEDFWQAIDVRIEATLSNERELTLGVLRDAIRAMQEVADATNERFDECDRRLAELAALLEKLRAAGNARTRAAEAEPLDLPRLPRDLN